MLTENQHFRLIADSTPRLGDQIARMWGDPEVEHFIVGLLRDIKDGRARGFAPQVAGALERLLDCHKGEQALAKLRDKPLPAALAENEGFLLIQQRFPHLVSRVAEVWGTPGCAAYINGLLNDTRGGQRQGFPPDVAVALFRLTTLHDEEYPELMPKDSGAWTLSNI